MTKFGKRLHWAHARHSILPDNGKIMLLILSFTLLATAHVFAPALSAQLDEYCVVEYSGENRDRTVAGRIRAECPGQGRVWPFHSAPFGNWGVTSNYGRKSDGQQFPGWHPGTISGTRRRNWQWNSCTTDARFASPNSEFYNADGNTTQRSTRGTARHGTRFYRVPIRCRGSAVFPLPSHGCRDSSVPSSYGFNENFMSLYELDWDGATLIETLYFPGTRVSITNCNQFGCTGGTSRWQDVSSSTSSAADVDAEMRMRIRVRYEASCGW